MAENASNFRTKQDDEYSFRAMVKVPFTTPKGEEIVVRQMFPPVQHDTVDNKNDFLRMLNNHLSSLDNWVSVDVEQGGKNVFSFDR
jgi:hypothetical protein